VAALGFALEATVIRPLWRRQAPLLVLILATLAPQVMLPVFKPTGLLGSLVEE